MTSKSKKNQSTTLETSKSIESLTEAFLKSGGKIEEVPSGVSGQQSLRGPRHIKIGNN